MTVSMDKKYVTRDGLYNAKVIYIHDKGDQPVIVLAEYKRDLASNTVFRTQFNGKVWHDAENPFDLIEVPEEKPAPTLDDYYRVYNISRTEQSHTRTIDYDPTRDPVIVRHDQKPLTYLEKAGIKAVLELAGVKV